MTERAVQETFIREPEQFPEANAVRLVLQPHFSRSIPRKTGFKTGLKMAVEAGQGIRQAQPVPATHRDPRSTARADSGKTLDIVPGFPVLSGKEGPYKERNDNPGIVRRNPEEKRDCAPAEKQPGARNDEPPGPGSDFQLDPGRSGPVCPKRQKYLWRQRSVAERDIHERIIIQRDASHREFVIQT
jgi:hypothetical protein